MSVSCRTPDPSHQPVLLLPIVYSRLDPKRSEPLGYHMNISVLQAVDLGDGGGVAYIGLLLHVRLPRRMHHCAIESFADC